jgi:hypothetical protein
MDKGYNQKLECFIQSYESNEILHLTHRPSVHQDSGQDLEGAREGWAHEHWIGVSV